jgi:hypothetical protein
MLFSFFYKVRKILRLSVESLHFTMTNTLKKRLNARDSHHCSRQKHHEWKQEERSRWWWRVTLPAKTCSGCNRITPLMRRPNTDSPLNIPVTLPHKQFFMRYVITSTVHTLPIQRYGTLKRCKCVPFLTDCLGAYRLNKSANRIEAVFNRLSL